jgi:DNA-binding YbaB/EbfC family protein
MLGQFGQLAHLLRNAGQIRENMKQVQERLEQAEFVGEAGAGQVRITVNGRGEIRRVRIDPELVKSGDVEMLEDLVAASMREATRQSREALGKEMSEATGGVDFSNMMNMLGGE